MDAVALGVEFLVIASTKMGQAVKHYKNFITDM